MRTFFTNKTAMQIAIIDNETRTIAVAITDNKYIEDIVLQILTKVK